MQPQGQVPPTQEPPRPMGDDSSISLQDFQTLLDRLADIKSRQRQVG